jgi:hypothetical protein
MEIKLSPKTKAKIFERKMKREKIFSCKIIKWQDRKEVQMCNVSRTNSTFGNYTIRTTKQSLMGEFNSPIYNVRASKIIRDTERFLRMWNDPEEKRKKLEQSRYDEVRGEIREKFVSLLNRENFFSYKG